MPHQPLTKLVYLHGLALRLVLPPPCRSISLHLRQNTRINRKIRIPWLEGHGGGATVWCSRSAMPWSDGAELSSATGAPISTISMVLIYVKHLIGGNAHDEALSRTLLVCGGLGAVLVFRPRRTLFCIMHYAESNNVVAWWECTLQKVRRKDAMPCMDELEVIVAVFEERSTRWRRTTTTMGVHTLNKI